MAEEETFIMVSLEEQKSKELAQVISNDTSRKILDFLGKKEAGESEISKALNIPISTVHYNIQQLVKAGLVESKEFMYSDKGKEVNIYTVSKKLIVIAPTKSSKNWKEALKGLVPFLFISMGMSFIIQAISNNMFRTVPLQETMLAKATEDSVAIATTGIQQTTAIPLYGLWFFLGSLFLFSVYLFYSVLKKN